MCMVKFDRDGTAETESIAQPHESGLDKVYMHVVVVLEYE